MSREENRNMLGELIAGQANHMETFAEDFVREAPMVEKLQEEGEQVNGKPMDEELRNMATQIRDAASTIRTIGAKLTGAIS